jgi:hypothetical protein
MRLKRSWRDRAFWRRFVLRGWGGELLRRDNRQEEEEKGGLSARRYFLTGVGSQV